jgi:hypothetical protein
VPRGLKALFVLDRQVLAIRSHRLHRRGPQGFEIEWRTNWDAGLLDRHHVSFRTQGRHDEMDIVDTDHQIGEPGNGRPVDILAARRGRKFRSGLAQELLAHLRLLPLPDETGHTDGQQATRRIVESSGAPEVGQNGQEEHVAERVRRRRQAHQQVAGSPEVGTDQEGPRRRESR